MLNNSLSNRFQGAFLGLALGYRLGQLYLNETNPQSINTGLNLSVLPKRIPGMTPMVSLETRPDQVILLHKLTQSILRHQGFDPVDYEAQWKAWVEVEPINETQPSTVVEIERKNPVLVSSQQAGLSRQKLSSEGEVAIFALPIALLFHENLKPLQNFLFNREDESPSGETSLILRDGVFAMASAIALLLTEKLEPDQIIPKILPKLSQETTLALQLEQVQILLKQNAPLETVVRQLIQTAKINAPTEKKASSGKISSQWTATALAFYCFLTTPEDYRLTLWRSIQAGYQPDITSAISGALSGAYQGLIGIPLHWRLALRSNVESSVNSSLAQNATVESKNWEKELLNLANQLLAVWSGVYYPITSKPFPQSNLCNKPPRQPLTGSEQNDRKGDLSH